MEDCSLTFTLLSESACHVKYRQSFHVPGSQDMNPLAHTPETG